MGHNDSKSHKLGKAGHPWTHSIRPAQDETSQHDSMERRQGHPSSHLWEATENRGLPWEGELILRMWSLVGWPCSRRWPHIHDKKKQRIAKFKEAYGSDLSKEGKNDWNKLHACMTFLIIHKMIFTFRAGNAAQWWRPFPTHVRHRNKVPASEKSSLFNKSLDIK